MATKSLPLILKENADEIVDQVANNVLEVMAAYPDPPPRKPFSNRLVRIVNSPDLVKRPLSDDERAAVREMIDETKKIRQRGHNQTLRLQEIQRRFELEMEHIENQEHLEVKNKLKQAEEKREAERQKRAEIALINLAKRSQLKQEEKQRLRCARDLIRRSSKTNIQRPGQKQFIPKPKQDVAMDPVARERWKHFIRRYRRTKWFKMIAGEIAALAAEKRRGYEDICARLIRRRDYGATVRDQHAPEPSAKLHDQLQARIDQLRHPDYVRQARDVRARHPVIGGKPGTEKPAPEPLASTAKKYRNYLADLHRIRVQNGPDEYRHLSKAELQAKIRELDREIEDRDGSHRPDATSAVNLTDNLARLSHAYLKALRANRSSAICTKPSISLPGRRLG